MSEDFITSYVGLFDPEAPGRTVSCVEIPLIQRDYAQGREDVKATRVRTDFLRYLRGAVEGGDPVGLDFVYGDIDGNGVFRPLDGQQRLTTLFLLHWYVAYRSGQLDGTPDWSRFKYATRDGAEIFCARIVQAPPPVEQEQPAKWIRNQPWYRYLWVHDPSIQSMLTMIDAIDEQFHDLDPHEAWHRLIHASDRAITLHVLLVPDMHSTAELYIKMNSRGKPLTDFETFKARFERWIEGSTRSAEFAKKIDSAWADLLWPYDTGDNVVDDEFMRVFSYLIQVCEWRNNRQGEGSLEERAQEAFSAGKPDAEENLDFLFGAFDSWGDGGPTSFFDEHFTTTQEDGRLHLFTTSDANLFRLACHEYGSTTGFSNAEALLLYAVLLHQIHGTEGFARRARVVRNLAIASDDEIRPGNMAKLVAEVETLIRNGDLSALATFNTAQIEDERRKEAILSEHPDLAAEVHALEDHEILRGSLMTFDLGPEELPARAATYHALMEDSESWCLLTGALLTKGNYSRPNHRFHPDRRRFGSRSTEGIWRLVLTGASVEDIAGTRAALMALLDDVGFAPDGIAATLNSISSQWLEGQTDFDWQYYLVRYDRMREGSTGLYVCPEGRMGFRLRMLYKKVLSSLHREPFVYAAWRESGVGEAALDPWFHGYQLEGCWLQLTESKLKVRVVDDGWEVERYGGEPTPALDELLAKHGVVDGHLAVQQGGHPEAPFDTVDRIQVAAALIKDIVTLS